MGSIRLGSGRLIPLASFVFACHPTLLLVQSKDATPGASKGVDNSGFFSISCYPDSPEIPKQNQPWLTDTGKIEAILTNDVTSGGTVMAQFFLSYDLRKSRNYQALYDELRKFKAVRILESTWCFNRVNTNCSGLRDYFRAFLDSDDGLVVSEVIDWAAWKVDGSPNDLT